MSDLVIYLVVGFFLVCSAIFLWIVYLLNREESADEHEEMFNVVDEIKDSW